MILFYILLLGGFVGSLAVAISYFASRRFDLRSKIILGTSCLIPLVSLALLFGGLFVSGRQLLALSPCVVAALFLCSALIAARQAAFRCSPIRGTVGLLSISWSGLAAFLSSHYCFMGACC
jgi:hypothetical protein